MSLILHRKRRTDLYLSMAGLLVTVAAVSAISARDPSGVSLRAGMVMVAVGTALWLPWRQLLPALALIWLGANFGRSQIEDYELFNTTMLLELPFVLGVGGFALLTRESLRLFEEESLIAGPGAGRLAGVNPGTGVYQEGQLRGAIDSELARARRFGREFSLVLVGIDEMRQKFDYRDGDGWRQSLATTARLLQQTRNNVDRVFHYGPSGFAMILPESDERDVAGMVRRLRRVARKAQPAEGEPAGPLPVHFGATFFPSCATTVDDLLRRAEVAMRIAEKNTLRYQIDSAEAPEMPPAETLRRSDHETKTVVAVSLPAAESRTAPTKSRAAGAQGSPPAAAPRGATATATLSLEEASSHAGEQGTDEQPEPAGSLDDIEGLLKQMDETLSLIKSVRSHAA